ncbi:hypothetical protein BpHYR1_006488 [Brachionus plicatilis]|uniref:Uncharacterized protein n=1 Tax=Brachionus plicatilis TaxID=10195 RepID=A0A3M7R0V9_BRAPC|nr:hypothetical protein BpHYR1_006488 [Brachionus plicatilis]
MFDIKKYARFRPMLEARRFETVEQLYMKHKIFFMKQLKNSKICWELLLFLDSDYSTFEQKNTSYCKQLKNLEKKIHFDPMEYSTKTSIVIIENTRSTALYASNETLDY